MYEIGYNNFLNVRNIHSNGCTSEFKEMDVYNNGVVIKKGAIIKMVEIMKMGVFIKLDVFIKKGYNNKTYVFIKMDIFIKELLKPFLKL